MLPIGDDNHDRQRWPIVTALFVAANVVAFFYELSLGEADGQQLAQFVQSWGVVPREFAEARDLAPTIELPFFVTLVSSMFLHAGWGHLLGNMLYLWVFGDNVEDRLGRGAFVVFYVAAGLAAAGAQIIASPDSLVPMIGASGAVSGVLGAYLVLFPKKRVRVLMFYVVWEVPAFVVLGFWAAMQLVSGYASVGSVEGAGGGGVAYLAHVGGLAAGVLVALCWRGTVARRRAVR